VATKKIGVEIAATRADITPHKKIAARISETAATVTAFSPYFTVATFRHWTTALRYRRRFEPTLPVDVKHAYRYLARCFARHGLFSGVPSWKIGI
jgi:hypothetical protein